MRSESDSKVGWTASQIAAAALAFAWNDMANKARKGALQEAFEAASWITKVRYRVMARMALWGALPVLTRARLGVACLRLISTEATCAACKSAFLLSKASRPPFEDAATDGTRSGACSAICGPCGELLAQNLDPFVFHERKAAEAEQGGV